jgi:peptide/nickel transport system permease protein
VQGGVIVATTLYILVVLLSDILIAWFDPRVRESL